MAAARSSPFTTNPKAPSRNSDGDFVLRPHYGLRTPTVLGFLVGDFNICDPAEGRLNSRCQTCSDGDAIRAAALLAAFSRSVDIAQLFFTRKNMRRDGSIHMLSPIDRVLVNLPMAEMRDFQCRSHTVGTIGDKSVPSDHIPVRHVIERPRQ